MAVIKRWWSELLSQHLLLRADETGYELTVAARELEPVELHFDTEADARAHAAELIAQHPDGEWRQQPL